MGQATTEIPIQRVRFASTDVDEVTDYIDRLYMGNHTDFGEFYGPAGFQARYARAGSIAADTMSCSIHYFGAIEPVRFFCSFALRHGAARVTCQGSDIHLRPGDSVCYSIGAPAEFDMIDIATQVVSLPWERLQQAAESMGVPGDQLRLQGNTPLSAAMANYWRHLVSVVNDMLMNDDSPARSPLMHEELIRLAAVGALHAFPNTTLTQPHRPGPGHVAPATVRRAVAYIDASAHLPVTVNDIAEAAGTGVRALQYGFRRHLGTSPLAYLRRVRLEHAHRELQLADPTQGDSVGTIAAKWGLRSSRFTSAYFDAFGELPSQTLRR